MSLFIACVSRWLAVHRYTSQQLAEKAQMTKEVQNAAMYILFYLCRVNHPRQIIAVEHEIIPVLIKVQSCSGTAIVLSMQWIIRDCFCCSCLVAAC